MIRHLAEYFQAHRSELTDRFVQFLRFPSISSEIERKEDVQRCANWVAEQLLQSGLKVETWETPLHPILFAETPNDPTKPTVLIYNHYDVQPVDPLELWKNPPFEPRIDGNEVYARGAQDNKGQCFSILTALRYWKDNPPPVNLKILIEGEEEIGSPNLPSTLEEKRDRLRADHLFIVDLGIHALDRPAVTLGVRGIVTISLELTGSNRDLHSGSHGGIVYNPNHAMIELLSKLRDPNGRILVPGFYDDVQRIDFSELSQISFDFNQAEYKHLFAAEPTGGERAYTPFQSAWLRPTLEVNGIGGGYTGVGFKTVIPAKCIAKLSCRLVPDQDPKKIADSVVAFLKQNVPSGLSLTADIHDGVGRAVRSSPLGKGVKATASAYEEVNQVPCHFILEGASIPIVYDLSKASGAEVILMGYGLPDDNIHAPNEHYGLDRINRGFQTIVRALELIAQ